MTKQNRNSLRMARRVFELRNDTERDSLSVALPRTAWFEFVRLLRLIAKADARNWSAASRRTREQLVLAHQALLGQLTTLQQEILPSESNRHSSGMADVYRDLQALQDEFVGVEFDRPNRQLTVTTEDICFDNLNLGPFDIVLDCHRLDDVSPYRVVAREPDPAADSRTTHPHVQDDLLCEGEGRVAIQRALSQGRIYDFFLIVRQILSTYNASSAYVRLSEWQGIHCRDCDAMVDSEEQNICSRCDTILCQDCTSDCSRCSDRCCHGCTDPCEACLGYFCHICLASCDKCDAPFCEECLTNGICSKCIKEEAKERESNAADQTPVHSVCLGEAALSS